MTKKITQRCCRVVLTGGPGGGKTTAVDLYRRELCDKVVGVPEAATLLYMGGFPRIGEKKVREATQKAIYHVQKNLEDAQAAHYPNRVLLCDRGTVDGAVYWPYGPLGFFKHLGINLTSELARYDAVIFFETAAIGGVSVESGNPTRIESVEQALTLDRKLKELWSQHPRFVFIPHNTSFMKKINAGLSELVKILDQGLVSFKK